MAVDPDTFRAVLGRFASGVTVVTALGSDGDDEGMTVTSFCSVSLEPPLVLICIDRAAAMYESIGAGSHFIVQMLSESQEAIARRFSGPDPNRFEGIGYTRGSHGIAILDDVLAYIECRRVAQHPAGDHRIYVGEVEEAVTYEGRPLLRYRSGYAQMER
jgi:4-nitrophenol 2-monooxygenase / 4-nitrocatechol 4-monooxygenase, reductase component